MFWILLTTVSLVALIILSFWGNKSSGYWSTTHTITYGICALTLLISAVISILSPILYLDFEHRQEVEQVVVSELFADLDTVSDDTKIVYTDTLVSINKELITYQVNERRFGPWNLTPARVLDLKPITFD